MIKLKMKISETQFIKDNAKERLEAYRHAMETITEIKKKITTNHYEEDKRL